MSPYSLFSGECSVVVTTLWQTVQRSDSPKHTLAWKMAASATDQRQSRSARAISGVFPEKWRMRNTFVRGDRKKTILRISTLNFSKASRTTWVQILRIIRKHENETVNIFSNKSYRHFFSYYKKRQNSTFLAFAKILSIGFLSKNCNI